ncbi:MAG: pyridoxamine 5'-phosphate oxidase family protein [Muribaculaceae bacterium]|nr:pyridoxamine 5'-phosphate oxidase family protein [Muribaculaceae bacterium]
MRRFKQQIPESEVKDILKKATNGVLCLTDYEDRPYGVPMSFIYDGYGSIYFHCALTGRKIECIIHNPNACFTIIDQDDIHPEEFTTYFKSVIVEGIIKIIKDRNEMIDALRLLSTKYSPGINCEPEIEKGIDRVLILKLEIDSISGKEAIELTKKRNQD